MTDSGPTRVDDFAQKIGHLAWVATEALYPEQPELHARGEAARERVLEDFEHHLRALACLNREVFARHVEYCYGMFAHRGFPRAWLDDAWRHMRSVVSRELEPTIARRACQILAAATVDT